MPEKPLVLNDLESSNLLIFNVFRQIFLLGTRVAHINTGSGLSNYKVAYLPRSTELPVRKRGDECSDLPVRGAPQSHGRKSVVRGLPN